MSPFVLTSNSGSSHLPAKQVRREENRERWGGKRTGRDKEGRETDGESGIKRRPERGVKQMRREENRER